MGKPDKKGRAKRRRKSNKKSIGSRRIKGRKRFLCCLGRGRDDYAEGQGRLSSTCEEKKIHTRKGQCPVGFGKQGKDLVRDAEPKGKSYDEETNKSISPFVCLTHGVGAL